jgi:hypothetical protein
MVLHRPVEAAVTYQDVGLFDQREIAGSGLHSITTAKFEV